MHRLCNKGGRFPTAADCQPRLGRHLARLTRPRAAVHSRLLFNDLRPWMEAVCGEPLHDKGSLFAAQYKAGGACGCSASSDGRSDSGTAADPRCSPSSLDTLLCHDDKLEGRRIAFILYLVPESWSEADGGHLELYGVNGTRCRPRQHACGTGRGFFFIFIFSSPPPSSSGKGRPGRIVKRICPQRGSMAFFPVMPVSFHRVSPLAPLRPAPHRAPPHLTAAICPGGRGFLAKQDAPVHLGVVLRGQGPQGRGRAGGRRRQHVCAAGRIGPCARGRSAALDGMDQRRLSRG